MNKKVKYLLKRQNEWVKYTDYEAQLVSDICIYLIRGLKDLGINLSMSIPRALNLLTLLIRRFGAISFRDFTAILIILDPKLA